MVLGKLTDAVADLAETLRRAFQDPPTHALDAGLLAVRPSGAPLLAASPQAPPFRPEALPVAAELALRAVPEEAPVAFRGRVLGEEGWARWAAGAQVCEMPVFAAGGVLRAEIPPLPRRPPCHRAEPGGFRASPRGLQGGFPVPAVRGGSPELPRPPARAGLDFALGLPVALQGQDVQALPKAQWMRYSLQLVKSTGENIRNLEVLGLYRIPSRGVASMRHDARSGRLLLQLDRGAAGAPRLPFLLARRKDDRTLVSCFLEEG